ncbi:MAG: sirohydrochlorin chelatase [Actinomycetota bacterium]|nr:sirohydrochlorin chelatase [Actinomycetota bacterium]
MTEPTGREAIVLLAHGSPDPRHASVVEAVTSRVREIVGERPVHTAYLDHHAPSATDVAAVASGGVLTPLLLTRATHIRDDVPVAARDMGALGRGSYVVADALGPDALLFEACEELLGRAGWSPRPQTAVVLYSGGSSAREAVTAIGEGAAQREDRGWGPWTVAALAGGEPLDVVVDRLRSDRAVNQVVVVTYVVADGILRDRMVATCREVGVPVAEGTLGDTDALAHLVVRRAEQALRLGSAVCGPPSPGPTGTIRTSTTLTDQGSMPPGRPLRP